MNAAASHPRLRFFRARRGPIALEYGLIIGVIVLALVAVTFTSGGIFALYGRVLALLQS